MSLMTAQRQAAAGSTHMPTCPPAPELPGTSRSPCPRGTGLCRSARTARGEVSGNRRRGPATSSSASN
eukprot:64852-Hanusia_phi.AAC.3